MPTARTRFRWTGFSTGLSSNTYTGDHDSIVTAIGAEYMEDVSGNIGGDNYQYKRTRKHAPLGTVSGTSDPELFFPPIYIWENVPYGSQHDVEHASLPSAPLSTLSAATQGAARTNPGRPVVSVPVFIGELKDILLELYDFGNKKVSKRRRSRNSVAEINFGWAPTFGDLQKFLDFGTHVDNRVKELTALHSATGLKRRWTTWTDAITQTDPYPTVIWSSGGQFAETVFTRKTESKQYVTCRWKPGIHPKTPPTATQLLQQARLAVHGWRISPADAWQLMPWSWFIDYFVNVGDWLEATSNSTDFVLDSCCVHTLETSTVSTLYMGTSRFIDVVPGKQTLTTYTRVPSGIGLTVTQPTLSAKQITTLAGIAANR